MSSAKISLLIFIVKCINCDWVEITRIATKNKKDLSVFPKTFKDINNPHEYTTPKTYEVFIKAPTNNQPFTTPSSYDVDRIDAGFDNVNIATTSETVVTKAVEFSSSGEASENSTTKANSDVDGEGDIDEESDEVEDLSYNGFMPFLESVQKNLLKTKSKSIYGKIHVLKHLRDHLLADIAKRMTNLWQPSPTYSEARGHKDEDDDYHMDFPSNEGALMTIGFLTFAVFLIKLVLKLIYALKYKQQYFNNMTTTTTGTALIYVGRKRRDTFEEAKSYENAAKILQLIEEYKFQ